MQVVFLHSSLNPEMIPSWMVQWQVVHTSIIILFPGWNQRNHRLLSTPTPDFPTRLSPISRLPHEWGPRLPQLPWAITLTLLLPPVAHSLPRLATHRRGSWGSGRGRQAEMCTTTSEPFPAGETLTCVGWAGGPGTRAGKTTQPKLQEEALGSPGGSGKCAAGRSPSSFHFNMRMTEWPTLLTAPPPSPPTRPGEEGSSSPQ